MSEVKPYQQAPGSKKEQVAGMFDKIAFKYDFLNHFLSAGIDKRWRKKVVKLVKDCKPNQILDVATGTGDLAIACMAASPAHIDGIDISNGMLEVGREKIKRKNLSQHITLSYGDAENIPFADEMFDVVTVAFGVRNFENPEKGLSEMLRILKPGGTCIILEFTMPRIAVVGQLYRFYFMKVLPQIGKIFSKDNSAYTYLPLSVEAFAQRDELIKRMHSVGFKNGNYTNLSVGIAAIYTASK